MMYIFIYKHFIGVKKVFIYIYRKSEGNYGNKTFLIPSKLVQSVFIIL